MTTAVLLMAYGSPRTPEDVAAYLQDIRGGREPSEHMVRDLKSRYQRIGGTSPLAEITTRQAERLQSRLGEHFRVYVGMKHWHPFIREAVERIAEDGARRVVGLALAPHYSAMSIGGYEERLLRARDELGASFEVAMVSSWYSERSFVELVSRNLDATLAGWDDSRVVFTAHSLPERIRAEGDPYVEQLTESAKLIAARSRLAAWELAFQSASPTGEPWLGPDVLQRLEALGSDGFRRVVIAPIGFVADHLEILFDVDVQCAQRAAELGIQIRRIPSPNDDPALADALASVVSRTVGA